MAYREKLRSARMGTGTEVSSSSTPSLFFSTYFSNAPILRTFMYHKYVITSYVYIIITYYVIYVPPYYHVQALRGKKTGHEDVALLCCGVGWHAG